MVAITIHSDFGAQENKVCHCFHFFPIYLPWIRLDLVPEQWTTIFPMKWRKQMPWSQLFEHWVLSQLFHSPLSPSSRDSSSSSLSAIGVVSSAYPRLLIFLLEILIPACNSSILAFHMMYSVYKLNKQGDNIYPRCTPFPVLNKFIVPCLVLMVASCPAYRFIKRQVRWPGIPISLRIFHNLLWSTQSKALV